MGAGQPNIQTDGSWQSREYDLSKYAVFFVSNSGRTKEVILLAQKLKEEGNPLRFGLTSNEDTILSTYCSQTHVLNCGPEDAVAATKSVVEQTLYLESILWNMQNRDVKAGLAALPAHIKESLMLPIPPEMVKLAMNAETIYLQVTMTVWPKSLRSKPMKLHATNPILEGTYAFHGVEEVMMKGDVVFWIDPILDEYEKIQDCLIKGAGVHVIAIADRDTPFPTIKTPSAGDFNPYVFLCAGWNLLVEIGIACGLDLDHPVRASRGSEIHL